MPRPLIIRLPPFLFVAVALTGPKQAGVCDSAAAEAPRRVGGQPVELALDNGLRAVLVEDHFAPVVAIQAFVRASAFDETADKAGLRHLTLRMLLRGTREATGDALAMRLTALGGRVEATAYEDCLLLSLQGSSDSARQLLAMAADLLRQPRFDEREFEKVRGDALQQVRTQNETVQPWLLQAVRERLFRDSTPKPVGYGLPTMGAEQSLRSLSIADVRLFYRGFFTPDNVFLTISGDFAANDVKADIGNDFGSWTGRREAQTEAPPFAFPDKNPLAINQRPAEVAWVSIAFALPGIDNPDYCTLRVISSILGEGVGSRLFRAMRNERGLAYQAATQYLSLAKAGLLVAYIQTDAMAVEEAKNAVLSELYALREEPVSTDELERAKSYAVGQFAMLHQRNADRAFHLGMFECLGTGWGFDQRFPSLIRAVTAEEVQQAARKYLDRYAVAVIMPR